MNDVQVLQNKAAKIILDRPVHSPASYVLASLNSLKTWNSADFIIAAVYVHKCINRLMDHFKKLLTNGDVHSYN